MVTSSGVSNRGPLGCRQATTGAERRERSSDGGAALNDEGVNCSESSERVERSEGATARSWSDKVARDERVERGQRVIGSERSERHE